MADPDRAAGAARFIEAVFDVLVRRPTLLVVDDVHWADRSTLTVLDYLSRRASAVPLAIVAAARDDEPAAIDALPIADGRRFEQVAVRRLDRREVTEQVATLLGRRPSRDLVARLFALSAGNPMFVEELLGADAGDGSGPVDGAAPVPSAALRSLVHGRIGRLADPTRRAVEALAVIGRQADPSFVGAVAELDETAADAALDDAVRGGVVVPAGRGYEVRHPIIGEVVAASIPARALRRLHGRAAAALDGETAQGVAAERARHWRLAGDARRAWSSSLEAADEAWRGFAFAEAFGALDAAIADWPVDEPGRSQAILRAAEAAWISGNANTALALARSAEAEPSGDPGGSELERTIAIGRYAWDAGQREASVVAFRRAIDQLDDATPMAVRARALWGSGRGHIGAGRYDEAYEEARASARCAVEAGQVAWQGEAMLLAGMARAWSGADGTDELRSGLVLAWRSGDPGCTGHGYQFLVDQLVLFGRRGEALRLALEGIARSDRLGIGSTHGSDVRGLAAHLLIDAGRWPEAEELLAPADPRALATLAQALLSMRRGDLAAAGEYLAATTAAGSIGGPGLRGGWLELARAELAWLAADHAGAARELDAIVLVPGVWTIDVAAWRARWEARLGRPQSVEPRPRHLDPELDRALASEIAAEQADVSARAPAWGVAAEAWASVGRPYDEGWARLRQAEAGFAGRDRSPARMALSEGTRIADELGATLLAQAADDLARRSRVASRPKRRPAADPTAVTERERDVLALLAEGRTNRDIAERLFLSPKTVEIHVSRLLDKLGARTRGEAVANARRQGVIE